MTANNPFTENLSVKNYSTNYSEISLRFERFIMSNFYVNM